MNKIYLFTFLIILFVGCDDSAPKNLETNSQTTSKQSSQTAAAPTQPGFQLPPITQELAQYLYDKCDYIDIIMYQEGFSMNISQKPSIQSVISSLSTANPEIGANCPARGRLFFQEKGQTIGEADLHFTSGVCAALVFYEKGQRTYTAQMTEQGANIFGNYFNNAAQLKQKAIQGQ